MSVLKNQRHERFAQALALGKEAGVAYVEAGYTENQGNAARLKGTEAVSARVAEILGNAAIRAEINEERVLRELGRIGFADVRNVVRWGKKIVGKGRRAKEIVKLEVLDSDQIDDDTAAAIAEISETASGRLKIKFHDKKAALTDLGRHFGMFKDKIELGGHIQVANTELLKRLLPTERQFMREMLQTAAKRLPAPANQNAGEIEETPAAGVTGE